MIKGFLDKKWLSSQQSRIQLQADKRYLPDLHIELDIQVAFDSLSRNKAFYNSARSLKGKLIKRGSEILKTQKETLPEERFQVLRTDIESLVELLSGIKNYDTNIIEWQSIIELSHKVREQAYSIEDELRSYAEEDKSSDGKISSGQSKYQHEIYKLRELNKCLTPFANYERDYYASLSNNPFLLLRGEAGSGKTHLLCEMTAKRGSFYQPTIFFFGDEFINTSSIWDAVLGKLNFTKKEELLTELSKRATTKKSRALIVIDAINESHNPGLWRTQLVDFINDIKGYPDVGLVLSVRDQFLEEFVLKKTQDLFTVIEHRGFEHKEWEAVSTYFKHFGLPLPEIPLILPEFRNPLFLLLLCLGSKKSKKRRNIHIIKGHEGSSYIFERYIEHVSEKVANQYGLDPQNTDRANIIWDQVVRQVAKVMVNNKKYQDTITEKQLAKIIITAYPPATYPSLNLKDFINSLEKEFVLSRSARYGKNYKVKEYVYRFPFQRFSDHFIVRYLLKRYLRSKDYGKLLKLFSRQGALGKIVHRPYSAGLIEALAVQIPEWLEGLELFSLIRGKSYYSHQQAFLNSIVWRKPNAFKLTSKDSPLRAIGYINKYGGGISDETLSTFLSVAAIPEHPLNAKFLHRFLLKQSMAFRDHIWSEFLHRSNEESSLVNNLLNWAWSGVDKTSLSDESLELACTLFSWFLTASNRFIRDKATKGLVSLLQKRLDLVQRLLERFEKVDDMYVSERLYAVAYACVLRGGYVEEDFLNLSNYVYGKQFRYNKPQKNILLRDYAMSLMIIASEKFPGHLKENLYKPPYKSSFPTNIPSKEELEKKYMPENSENRDYSQIWWSIMGDDFGRYVVEHAVDRWGRYKLDESRPPTNKEMYERFIEELSEPSKAVWDEILENRQSMYAEMFKGIGDEGVSSESNTIMRSLLSGQKKLERQLVATLSEEQKDTYKTYVTPYMDKGEGRYTPTFDREVAKSWIFKRCIELGWDPKLHKSFDQTLAHSNYARSSHKPERIGKKYQWIALYEFLSMLADNYIYQEGFTSKVVEYSSPTDIYLRNIDPSRLFPRTAKSSLSSTTIRPKFKKWGEDVTVEKWLEQDEYLPPLEKMVKLNNKYLLLRGYNHYEEDTPPEVDKSEIQSKDLGFIITSYIVSSTDLSKLYKWATKQNFFGRWMSETQEISEVFLYEYPSASWAGDFSYSTELLKDREKGRPVDIALTCAEYQDGGDYDCSGDSERIYLPSGYLIKNMELRQAEDGIFVNPNGKESLFDAYAKSENTNALLANKSEFFRFLKRKDLAVLWTILGEKRYVGGEIPNRSGKRWRTINAIMAYSPREGWNYHMSSRWLE